MNFPSVLTVHATLSSGLYHFGIYRNQESRRSFTSLFFPLLTEWPLNYCYSFHRRKRERDIELGRDRERDREKERRTIPSPPIHVPQQHFIYIRYFISRDGIICFTILLMPPLPLLLSLSLIPSHSLSEERDREREREGLGWVRATALSLFHGHDHFTPCWLLSSDLTLPVHVTKILAQWQYEFSSTQCQTFMTNCKVSHTRL